MAVTTLAGAVVGALVGSLGTYILQSQRRIRQQQNQIDNLRNSLLAELSNMDDLIPSDYDGENDTVPIGMSIPSNVYESNSQNLSMLKHRETDTVIRFYSGALKIQKMTEEAADILSDEDASPEDIIQERGGKDNIRQEWIRCVVTLLENSDNYPDAIKFEGREINPDSDIGFKDLWVFLNHEAISDRGMQAEPIVSDVGVN